MWLVVLLLVAGIFLNWIMAASIALGALSLLPVGLVYLVAGVVLSIVNRDIFDEYSWGKAKVLAKVAAGVCMALAVFVLMWRMESAGFAEGLTIFSAYAAYGMFIIYG